MKLLLSHKFIDVNAQTDSGWTALSLAAHEGHTDIVKILLDVETIDVNLGFPLHMGAGT